MYVHAYHVYHVYHVYVHHVYARCVQVHEHVHHVYARALSLHKVVDSLVLRDPQPTHTDTHTHSHALRTQHVAGAAPCGLADEGWGVAPSYHKARSVFNSRMAARAKGFLDGLGDVLAVTCLPVGARSAGCVLACYWVGEWVGG